MSYYSFDLNLVYSVYVYYSIIDLSITFYSLISFALSFHSSDHYAYYLPYFVFGLIETLSTNLSSPPRTSTRLVFK